MKTEMKNKTRTLIENEERALYSELSGIESKILALRDREHRVRTELTHVAIQKARLEGLPE